jgi:hypothetical protein
MSGGGYSLHFEFVESLQMALMVRLAEVLKRVRPEPDLDVILSRNAGYV